MSIQFLGTSEKVEGLRGSLYLRKTSGEEGR